MQSTWESCSVRADAHGVCIWKSGASAFLHSITLKEKLTSLTLSSLSRGGTMGTTECQCHMLASGQEGLETEENKGGNSFRPRISELFCKGRDSKDVNLCECCGYEWKLLKRGCLQRQIKSSVQWRDGMMLVQKLTTLSSASFSSPLPAHLPTYTHLPKQPFLAYTWLPN